MARVRSGGWGLRLLGLTLVSGNAGCGPDTKEEAALDEICGEPGPFRLLELDADRPLSFAGQTAHAAGRRLVQVGFLDPEQSEDYPYTASTELWSVGECGETPMRIADDVDWVYESDVWPGVLVGCREATGELVTIDPLGERPSHVVYQTAQCGGNSTPWGMITTHTREDGTGALVLLPYPEDPWTESAAPTTLLDPIRMPPAPEAALPSDRPTFATFDDEVFAITPDHDLVRVSLLDGTVEIEASGVRQFQVSSDLRWLIWQDVVMTETDNPEWPEGAIFLRDRSSDAVVHLADTSLSYTFYSPFSFIEDDIVRLYLGGFGTQPQRFFSLADGTSFDIPPGNQATGRVDDGRWLMSGFWGNGPFALFDPASRTSQSLFEHEASLRWDGDRFLAVQGLNHILSDRHKTGRLWSIDLDGTRELLANRVSRAYQFLDEHRVVDVLEHDDLWRGELVVVDTTSRSERRVDERTVRGNWVLDDGKTLLYGVSDDDRTGVWLARPSTD